MSVKLLNDYNDAHITPRRELFLLIGIVVLTLGTRLTVALLTTSWIIPSEQNFWKFGFEMGEIAASLASGNGFSWLERGRYALEPTAWMPPIYPFIMGVIFKIFGIYSPQAAMVIECFQTIMSGLSCVFLYLIGKHLFNAKVGLLAAFLFALYPTAIHYAVGYIWGTSLFVCSALCVIWLFLRQAKQPDVKSGVGLGIAMGFTALVDPTIITTYPFALAWLYWRTEGDRQILTKSVATMLLSCFLIIFPWLVRNYLVFDRPVFIKSNFGLALIMGNNEYATGRYDDHLNYYKNLNKNLIFTKAELEHLNRLDEVENDRALRQKAVAFIINHPIRFLQTSLKRFLIYWTYMRPVQGIKAMMAKVAYYTVLVLSIAGMYLSRGKGREFQLVVLFILSLPLPYYFTIVGIFRYRFPIEVFLMVFSGYAIYWVMYQREKRVVQRATS